MKLEIEYKKLKAGLKKKTIKPAEITDLNIWDFHNVSDLTFLEGMLNLRRFDAGMRWGKNLDFSRITACKNLEELDFNNDNTIDLSWLADLPKLKVLATTGDKLDYHTLPPMPQLESFFCGGEFHSESLPDYSILGRFPNLRKLLIRVKGQKDLGFLRYVPKLESLDLNDSEDENGDHTFADISHLALCPNLQELEMSYFDGVDDITVIGTLAKLKRLKLYNLGRNNKKVSISPISKLTELESLTLDEMGTMSGYNKLSALTKLRHLSIKCLYDKKLADINFLSGLANLQHLDIGGQPFINSLEPLRSLTELEYLNIGGINEKLEDFSVLNGLTKLKEFHWYQCPRGKYLRELKSPVLTKLSIRCAKYIDNCGVISQLTGLEELDASYSNISSLHGIESFTKLRVAKFEECKKLFNLYGIDSCTALEDLCITACSKLDDLSLLKKNKSLTSLTMYRCRVDLNTLPKRKSLRISS